MAFCGYLKQSTAVTIILGPFVDEGDGKTAETGLTIAQADVRLSKNGANMAQKNEASSCTHDEIGQYACDLDTTDTNTLGLLDVMVHESGALPIKQTYQVVKANWYDTMCSTENLDANVAEISDDSTAADDWELLVENAKGTDHRVLLSTDVQSLEATFDVNAKNVGGSAATAQTGDVYAALPTNFSSLGIEADGQVHSDVKEIEGIDATNQIRDAVVDDSTRIDASALNTLSGHDPGSTLAAQTDVSGLNDPTAATIADAVWDEARSGHTGAGSFGETMGTVESNIDNLDAAISSLPSAADIRSEIDSNSTQLSAIVGDTNELQTDWADGGRLDLLVDGIKSKTDNLPADPADDSDIDSQLTTITNHLADIKGATFNGTTDSLEAIRNRGDAAWITATGFSTHSAADVWSGYDNTVVRANDSGGAALATSTAMATVDGNVDTLVSRVPAVVAQKRHFVNGTGDITPPENIGIWDAFGDGTKSISGLNDIAATDVWNVAARTLTAATNITSDGNTIDQTKIAYLDQAISTTESNIRGADSDTIKTISDQIDGLNNLSAADVNGEVVDVIRVDTISEMAQGAPPASPTLSQAINYLYRSFRNKITQTNTTYAVRNDTDDEDLFKATVSDDGTTFTKGELVSGS